MKPKTSEILDQIVAETQRLETSNAVLATLGRASDQHDFYMLHTKDFIAGGGVEIRMAVRAVAKVIKPKCYLGVGVRYGWSDAQALAEMDDLGVAVLVDMWQEGYAGLETKGPEYACCEIEKMIGKGHPDPLMVNGNSHIALPVVAQALRINLAVVDGDHSATGAWCDLVDVMRYIEVGGAVIFDDIFDTAHEMQLGLLPMDVGDRMPYPLSEYSLLKLWRKLPEIYTWFAFWDNADQGDFPFGVAPVGIAVRVK